MTPEKAWMEAIHTKEYAQAIIYLQEAIAHTAMDDRTLPSLYNNLGNVYRILGEHDPARLAYEKAVQLDARYAPALCNLGALASMAHHDTEALGFYRDAVHADPESIQAHFQLGLLLLKQTRYALAQKQFTNVIVLDPEHTQAYFYLGVIALHAEVLEAAQEAFENTLMCDKTHVEAYNNLGVIALKQDRRQEAVQYFTMALAHDNSHETARANLAATFMHFDRYEQAKVHYETLLSAFPDHIKYRYNLACAEMNLGRLETAASHFQRVLTNAPEHAASCQNLAAIAMRCHNKDQAIAYLQKACRLNPDDRVSRHLHRALVSDKHTPESVPAYAKNLFDHYAARYDDHMHNTLNYQVPDAIMHYLDTHRPHTHPKTILDLGCGTGLMGKRLRVYGEHLTGLDISTKMLEQAGMKQCYDDLTEQDILTWADTNTQQYDWIIAADVLPYLGDLAPFFAAISHALTPEGLCIITTEISDTEDYILQPTARFAHHKRYLSHLAAAYHLTVRAYKIIPGRYQDDTPLSLALMVLTL